MTVFYTVTTRIATNPQKAMAWATDLTDYIRENLIDSIQLLSQVGGPQGVITFVSRAENMGEFETLMAKAQADAGYNERVQSALDQGLLDPSHSETALWTAVG